MARIRKETESGLMVGGVEGRAVVSSARPSGPAASPASPLFILLHDRPRVTVVALRMLFRPKQTSKWLNIDLNIGTNSCTAEARAHIFLTNILPQPGRHGCAMEYCKVEGDKYSTTSNKYSTIAGQHS